MSRIYLRISGLLLLLLSLSVTSQELLIKDARIHTMGSAGVLESSDILIRNGKIAKIGKSLTADTKIQVIDAAGRELSPGLFGGLGTVGLGEISLESSTIDQQLDLQQMRPEFSPGLAYNPASSLVAINRIEGVLYTVLSPTQAGSIIEGQGSTVLLDGKSMPSSAQVLFISMGAAAKADSGGSRAAQFMLLEQAFTEAQKGGDQNGQFRLLTHAGRATLKQWQQKPVIFMLDRAADIRQALGFIKRHKLNAVIAGAAEGWMLAAELKAAGIPVIIDPLVNLPGSFDSLGARLDNAAILAAAGVEVMFSAAGASAAHNMRKIRQSAGNAVANGMPYAAAMAAITSVPAKFFGYAGGQIKVGEVANLVIWDGDPLEVTSAAYAVIIKGENTAMVSRQTLLRDRYLPTDNKLPRAYIHPGRSLLSR